LVTRILERSMEITLIHTDKKILKNTGEQFSCVFYAILFL